MNDKIFWFDFQSAVNSVFFNFIFQQVMSSLLRTVFLFGRPSMVCICTLLFCCASLGTEITEWELDLNLGMGTDCIGMGV